jgi:nicotinate-nucleotide pyrophosphorylase (carboxylating)
MRDEEIQIIDSVILHALKEDIGHGDITSLSIIPEEQKSTATVIAKEDFLLAGMPFFLRVFQLVDPEVQFRSLKKDGTKIKNGQIIARIRGRARSLLAAERTALNILQRVSGIATLTERFVREIKGLKAEIIDTRKTMPLMRIMDKYGVRVGGGKNHRFGLYDGVLIKDNHIAVAGSIEKAVKLARENAHHLVKIEVEVDTIDAVEEALRAEADALLLDNMDIETIKKAVDIIKKKKPEVIIEVSGGVSLENVRKIAECGVDLISIGALTHSVKAVDISIKLN